MASEKRLTDANAIKYREISYGGWGEPDEVADKHYIDNMPTVDAVEVVHGRWEEDEPPKHYIFTGVDVLYRCSECNNRFVHDTHYCPNCGAKMDGDGNG